MHYYEFGIFRLDVSNRELLSENKHISLTQKSFEILFFLIENRDRILKKSEILEAVWAESYVEEANLAQHIYMVRKALKSNGNEQVFIETVPKYGYRFVGEVTENLVSSADLVNPVPVKKVSQPHLPSSNGFVQHSNSIQKVEPLDAKDYSTKKDKRIRKSSKRLPNLVFVASLAIILTAFLLAVLLRPSSGDKTLSEIRSISILPFKQIGDGKDDKFGLGLADTLISRLSHQDEIKFSPTAMIARYSESGSEDSISIGRQLNVDAVLTGTIQRENGSVRVNVQLISVANKTRLWSDKFDVKFSDVFSLQDQVSEELAQKLSIGLDKNTPRVTEAKYIPKAAASEEFSKGLEYWNKRSGKNLPKIVEHFSNAVKLDENFALAYAHLADAYSLVGFYNLEEISPRKVAFEQAEKMANRALNIDPDNSEAYNALAMVAFYQRKNADAKKLYQKAIELNPHNATAHQRLAWMLSTKENLNDAIKEMRLAQQANPESSIINLNLARLLKLNRQTDEALDFCKKAVEIDPGKAWTRLILAEIYEQKGQLDKSIHELKSVPKNAPEERTAKLLLSRVYAKKGKNKEARKILKTIKNPTKGNEDPSYEVATVYAHLGDKKEAVKNLKKAKDDSLIYFLHLKYDYNMDKLRNTPEYSEILSQSKKKVTKEDKKS